MVSQVLIFLSWASLYHSSVYMAALNISQHVEWRALGACLGGTKTPMPSRSQLEFKASPTPETLTPECKDEFPSIDGGLGKGSGTESPV